MEIKTVQPYLIIIALMLLTSAMLAMTVDVSATDEAGIRLLASRDGETYIYLPDKVGEWTGREVRLCQNPVCRRQSYADELDDIHICPYCGGKLSYASIEEIAQLPRDTAMIKKLYSNVLGENIYVSVVLSGRERSSIHRPQVCLVGQGNTIESSEVVPVHFKDGDKLRVMILNMVRNMVAPTGARVAQHTYYAYWFVGKGRETPHHIERMIWMAADRIFNNVSHRWAYIGISATREASGKRHYDEVREFIRELYPYMKASG